MASGILRIENQVIVLQHVRRILPVRPDESGAGIWEFFVEFVNGDRVSFNGKKVDAEQWRAMVMEKLEAYWDAETL